MGNALHRGVDEVKAQVMETQLQMGDMQRQTQVAMQVAFARDQFAWGSALYALVLLGAGAAAARGKFHPATAAPVVLGGFALAYVGDMAYGNKLIRVRQEAEHIVQSERTLLVPPKHHPARKNWTKEAALLDAPGRNPGRISDKWYNPVHRS